MKALRSLMTAFVIMIAVAGAYAGKPSNAKFTSQVWTVDNAKTNANPGRVYIILNVTGLIEGVDYECIAPLTPICVIHADSVSIISDASGTYILITDITQIDRGTLVLL